MQVLMKRVKNSRASSSFLFLFFFRLAPCANTEEEGGGRGDEVGAVVGVEAGGAEPEPSQWLATGERG